MLQLKCKSISIDGLLIEPGVAIGSYFQLFGSFSYEGTIKTIMLIDNQYFLFTDSVVIAIPSQRVNHAVIKHIKKEINQAAPVD